MATEIQYRPCVECGEISQKGSLCKGTSPYSIFMNCIATQCHGDGFTNKLTCNICGGVVHKGTSRAQRGLIIIALGHLKKYHNSHHRNIFPMVELYINYGVDPQETDKRMVAEYLVDNPQPLFLSKVSDSSFPNGNMFFVDDY